MRNLKIQGKLRLPCMPLYKKASLLLNRGSTSSLTLLCALYQ